MRDVAQRPGADLFLGHQPAAAETLGIADHDVHLGLLDGVEHPLRLGEIGGERLLDQHGDAVRDAGQRGFDVQMLVGGDDGGIHFRSREQFAEVRRDEVRPDLFRDQLGALRVLLGDADPFHLGMASGDLPADEADATGSDDGQPDLLGLLSSSRTSLVGSGWAARPAREDRWPHVARRRGRRRCTPASPAAPARASPGRGGRSATASRKWIVSAFMGPA